MTGYRYANVVRGVNSKFIATAAPRAALGPLSRSSLPPQYLLLQLLSAVVAGWPEWLRLQLGRTPEMARQAREEGTGGQGGGGIDP